MFWIAQSFFTWVNTVLSKIYAHVTAGILSTYAKICTYWLKIIGDEKNNGNNDNSCAQGQTLFLTLEMSWMVKYTQECAWCIVHRVLSQNHLWTNGYRDSRQDEWVWATNLKVVDYWKEGPEVVCCRH